MEWYIDARRDHRRGGVEGYGGGQECLAPLGNKRRPLIQGFRVSILGLLPYPTRVKRGTRRQEACQIELKARAIPDGGKVRGLKCANATHPPWPPSMVLLNCGGPSVPSLHSHSYNSGFPTTACGRRTAYPPMSSAFQRRIYFPIAIYTHE